MLLCVCIVTIVTVSDAILQHSVPLLLLLLGHHTEVVVAGVWVPQDEGEPGCTLDEWVTAHFGLDTCNGPDDEMRFQKHFRRGMFNITITIRQTVEGEKDTNDISIYFCRHVTLIM